jgi:hypothetical protein
MTLSVAPQMILSATRPASRLAAPLSAFRMVGHRAADRLLEAGRETPLGTQGLTLLSMAR